MFSIISALKCGKNSSPAVDAGNDASKTHWYLFSVLILTSIFYQIIIVSQKTSCRATGVEDDQQVS